MPAHPERSRGGDSLGDLLDSAPNEQHGFGPVHPERTSGCSFDVMCGEAAPLLGMNGTAVDHLHCVEERAPGTQVEWKPMGIFRGNLTRAAVWCVFASTTQNSLSEALVIAVTM